MDDNGSGFDCKCKGHTTPCWNEELGKKEAVGDKCSKGCGASEKWCYVPQGACVDGTVAIGQENHFVDISKLACQ